MSDGAERSAVDPHVVTLTERSAVEPYVLRLLDECRDEVKMCDSKASILFAGVSFAAALLAQPLIDETSSLRSSGSAVVVLSIASLAVLASAIGMLGLAVMPRVAHPTVGKARYFEEQATFADAESLLAVVAGDAEHSVERHTQQLLVLSQIAHRKYRQLRGAMLAVCVAVGLMVIDAIVAALDIG